MEQEKQIKFVKFRTFPSRLYAEMLKEVLENEGIPSIIKSDDVGILGTGSYASNTLVPATIWIPEDKVDYCTEISDQMLDHI